MPKMAGPGMHGLEVRSRTPLSYSTPHQSQAIVHRPEAGTTVEGRMSASPISRDGTRGWRSLPM